MTRTAISPRLAISIRLNIRGSERYVAVLAGRIAIALVLEHLERADQPRPRIVRHQHLIYIAQLRRLEWVRESSPIILDQPRALLFGIFGANQLAAKNYVDGLLRSHHRDL